MTGSSLPPRDPNTRVPSVEILLALHQRLLAAFGGQEGLTCSAEALDVLVELALSRAYSASTSSLAAGLLQDIVQNKPFVSGNRRTAWTVACLVVAMNKEPMEVPDYAQATRIILGTEKGMFTREELARYFGKLILIGRTMRDSLQAEEEKKAKRSS